MTAEGGRVERLEDGAAEVGRRESAGVGGWEPSVPSSLMICAAEGVRVGRKVMMPDGLSDRQIVRKR